MLSGDRVPTIRWSKRKMRRGLTRLQLIVSPRIGEIDEEKIVLTFIRFLKSGRSTSGIMGPIGVRNVGTGPHASRASQVSCPDAQWEILPFHIMERSQK